ncbi:MAG: hypothetical protein H6865_00295 [Rhodospirillales bacterium]|nr:hypothetical protein [Alphaproteobacteria bacterium]MCB9986065.1 hypothetical protein [Rhodospirillales bacterium]USO07367.1 MAG: hypothetical protein H6866_08080 [Rhodospirillales bacterium]
MLTDATPDPDQFLEIPVTMPGSEDVPGWYALETFLRGPLGISGDIGIETFRKFYNHYLKRFPLHYFTGKTVPGLDFAVYLPASARWRGINKPHYLVLIKPEGGDLSIFYSRIPLHVRSRLNFYNLTKRWLDEGLKRSNYLHDVREILRICQRPDELFRMRTARYHGFLRKARWKIRKTRDKSQFREEWKWTEIRKFLDLRDQRYISMVVERIVNRHISKDALDAAWALAKDRNVAAYNWLTAGNGPEAQRNRIQLAQAMPWLALALSDERLRDAYRPLEPVIDSGEKLIPAMQDLFSQGESEAVSAAAIRKLVGLDIPPNMQAFGLLRPVMGGISRHLPSFFPDPAHLGWLSDGQRTTAGICSYLSTDFFFLFASLTQDEKKALLERDTQQIFPAWNNTRDYLQEVYRKLVLPYFAARAHQYGQTGLGELAIHAIKGTIEPESFLIRNAEQRSHPPFLRPFGNIGFLTMVRLSEHWHQEQKRYVRYMSGIEIGDDLHWPGLLAEPVTAPNGIRIESVTSKRGLIQEFSDMHNCIRGFAPNCLGLSADPKKPETQNFSHLFRLAAKGGKHRATLELLEPFAKNSSGDSPVLRFGQIENPRAVKDVKNVPDDREPEVIAAKWLLGQFNTGHLKVDWPVLRARRRTMMNSRSFDRLYVEIGFDPRDEAKRAEAFLAMRPFLPDGSRFLEYEDWIEKMGFAADADILFPANAPANTHGHADPGRAFDLAYSC